MSEVPAVWAAPDVPVAGPATAVATRAAPRETEVRGHEGLRPIPLRPLTVLEVIDGAIGAVRAIPPTLLGWASLLVTGLAVLAFAALWVFDAAVSAATRIHPLITTNLFGDTTVQFGKTGGGGSFGLVAVNALVPIVCSGFAVTVLAGLFAESIKRHVDGAAAASNASAHRLRESFGRLFAIAAVTALPRVILLLLYALVTLVDVNDPNSGQGGWLWLVSVLGIPPCLWLTADWAVAAPVAALEGSRARAALGRARGLALAGRWRTMWATALTLLIAALVTAPLIISQYYIGSTHGVSDLIDGDPVSGAAYWWSAGYLVVFALIQVLTAPFRAALATMLYVDRRFRREGLDIRIAWARVARSVGNGKGGGR